MGSVKLVNLVLLLTMAMTSFSQSSVGLLQKDDLTIVADNKKYILDDLGGRLTITAISTNLNGINSFSNPYTPGGTFFLGLFSGIILIFLIYNLVLFFFYKDKAYLFYLLYAFSIGAYLIASGPIGADYLSSYYPVLNTYWYSFFLTLTSLGVILYTKAYLNIGEKLPVVNKLVNAYLLFRVGFFFLGLFLPSLANIPYLEILSFTLVCIASIVSFRQGYKPALFLIISFTILFAGFLIASLRIAGYLPTNFFTIYSLHLATIVSIVTISLAQGERVKELREGEFLRDKVKSELEQKVAERTDILQMQNDFIQEKVANLDSFIYKVTHDLKGPLKSIIGLARSAKLDKKTDPEVYYDYIIKSSERLDAVINDLLAISRTEGKKLIFSEISFAQIVDEIINSYEGNTNLNDIDFYLQLDQRTCFISERTLIYSVFQNLIENAVNYRKNEGDERSYLEIVLVEHQDECVISFKDNGIGISEYHLKKVFDMFYRADERHHHKSTGLGLYMVKLSLERLNSSIDVESKEGEGTTFTIRLKNFKQSQVNPAETSGITVR